MKLNDMLDIGDRIRALQAEGLPRLDWRSFIVMKDGSALSEEHARILDAYFRRFVELPKNEKGESVCLGCDLPFCKDELTDALLGGSPFRASWRWSLAHGERHCTKCGWPARAYHYDIGKSETSEALITRMTLTLAIHPDELRLPTDGVALQRERQP